MKCIKVVPSNKLLVAPDCGMEQMSQDFFKIKINGGGDANCKK